MNIKKMITTVTLAAALMSFSVLNSFAYNASSQAKLPNTNYYVQSNVWQSFTWFFQTHSFAVSAKLFKGAPSNGVRQSADRIKTTWSFSPTGIGVSVKGVSAGIPSGAGFSGSWENTNAWISDISGTFKISGVPLYSNFSNTAFALKSGVKATTSANCFRFY